MHNLIALTGPAGSGKSFIANMLVNNHHFIRVKFADGLKTMLGAALEFSGVPHHEVPDYIEGSRKESPVGILGGRSPRHAMQTLGEEWGRQNMHSDFWVLLTKPRVESLLWTGYKVVIDDCRYDNEARMVHRLGGTVALVHRSVKDTFSSHISEQGVSPELINTRLDNTGNANNARISIDYLLSGVRT